MTQYKLIEMYQHKLKGLRIRLRPLFGIVPLWNKLRSFLRSAFLTGLELVPLTFFLAARSYDAEMPKRILIAGGVAFLFFFIHAKWKKFITHAPINIGVNLFFIWASIILILPLPALQIFFLKLGEVGMYTTVLIVFVWQYFNSRGPITSAQDPTENKKYSRVLIGICLFSIVIAHYFKGNENLAGAMPYMIILFSSMGLTYFQSRAIKRNLEYAAMSKLSN